MRYEFIDRHRHAHSVKKMSQMLKVSRSGFHAWRERAASQREQENEKLVEQIRQVHHDSRQTYGSPRIHAGLNKRGIACGRNRVARLMHLHGIRARKPKRKHPLTTQRQAGRALAPNLLAQNFTAQRPNQKWVTDITYIDTEQGWLYLASILDLFGRLVVGWSMADHMETSLVDSALDMALGRRVLDGQLLFHSDQGSQFTSAPFQSRLADLDAQVSMSRAGNCYDNAVIESFFSTLKTECAAHRFASHREARTAIFEFIEVWYNRQRLHSSLGFLSPAEFESQFYLEKNCVH